jgi:SAM-dependent methyltransferase
MSNTASFQTITEKWIKLKKSQTHFSHQYLEKPAIFDLFLKNNLNNKKVLCLGCGEGSECQIIKDAGAKMVLGIDSSQSLIENAKYTFTDINFEVQDIAKLDLTQTDFDFVFSSLCLHYLPDWTAFFRNLKRFVKSGAKMVFSVHHPIKWAGKSTRNKDFNEFKIGYKKNKKNPKEFEIYGDYLNFNELQDTLFGKLKIKFYNRSISQIFQEIQSSGWQINTLIEPKPILKSKKIAPDFYATYSKIPLFLILEIKSL